MTTQEELLFADISGRIGNLEVETPDGIYPVIGIDVYNGVQIDYNGRYYRLNEIKPILYSKVPSDKDGEFMKLYKDLRNEYTVNKYPLFDFFNKVGYDYRGLIKMGLASEGSNRTNVPL